MTSKEIVYLIGQMVGVVASLLIVSSFQAKKRLSLLLIQTASCIFWAIHFFMIGQATGSILNLICVVRNLIYAKKNDWKWAGTIASPISFVVLSMVVPMLTYQNIFSIIPMIGNSISSIAFFLNKERTIRILSIFVSVCWLLYNISAFSVPGIITETSILISITVALIRFRKQKTEPTESADNSLAIEA